MVMIDMADVVEDEDRCVYMSVRRGEAIYPDHARPPFTLGIYIELAGFHSWLSGERERERERERKSLRARARDVLDLSARAYKQPTPGASSSIPRALHAPCCIYVRVRLPAHIYVWISVYVGV